jgi:hypothetical protein
VKQQAGQSLVETDGKLAGGIVGTRVLSYALHDLPRHESATHLAYAKQIAALTGCIFAGSYNAIGQQRDGMYFVPSRTLLIEEARRLGIRSSDHLYGGVVPAEFVGTKAITHELVGPHAAAPAQWSFDFERQVRPIVHRGFTVFSMRDAQRVGEKLVLVGTVRVKPTRRRGAFGQAVVTNPAELMTVLTEIDEEEIQSCGLVFEENLSSVNTWSVGTCQLAGMTIAYLGTQRLTTNNHGESVYGGSDLYLVRGDLQRLLAHELSHNARLAVDQARLFDAAVGEFYPEVFASRRNYDVAQGVDWQGSWRSGVLEQSWRIGGATSAELLAFTALKEDPELAAVRAASVELYGDAHDVPLDAIVYFRGVDDRCGPMIKYAIRHADP